MQSMGQFQKYNIHVMGISRVDTREKGPENILKRQEL